MSSADERLATLCSDWPKWLADAVEEAMAICDEKDWSTEQVVGYAILRSRTQPSPSSADKISDERLAEFIDLGFEGMNGREARAMATELATRRAQSAVSVGDYALDRFALVEAAADPSLTDAAVRLLITAKIGATTAEVSAWAAEALNATQEGK